jgi:hypothetical protein
VHTHLCTYTQEHAVHTEDHAVHTHLCTYTQEHVVHTQDQGWPEPNPGRREPEVLQTRVLI